MTAITTNAKRPAGLGAALLTARNKAGRVDPPKAREYVAYLVEAGLPLLFTTGTYGEGPLIPLDELQRLLRGVVDGAAGRAYVIANIGIASTEESVARARVAVEAGVDAVSSTPPFYYAHDEPSIRRYFEALAAVRHPMIVYNNPGRAGINLSVGLVVELARSLPLVAMKESADGMRRHVELRTRLPRETALLGGSDDTLLQVMALGAAGGVAVLAAVFPKLFVEMDRAMAGGDLKRAAELQEDIIAIRGVLGRGPYVGTYKALSRALGHDIGGPAAPLREPTDKEWAELTAALGALPAYKRATEGR